MNRKLLTLSIFGAIVLFASAASAQSVDEQPISPDPALQTEPSPTPAIEQSVEAAPPSLQPGTKAEAEHSAEVTARKSVGDPNNQRGTSLQGRTRPIAGADIASPNGTTVASTAPEPDSTAGPSASATPAK
jgi:hypothetical protein